MKDNDKLRFKPLVEHLACVVDIGLLRCAAAVRLYRGRLEDNRHMTNIKIRAGRDGADVALDRPRASPAWGGLASWAGSGGGRVWPGEGEDALAISKPRRGPHQRGRHRARTSRTTRGRRARASSSDGVHMGWSRGARPALGARASSVMGEAESSAGQIQSREGKVPSTTSLGAGSHG
jgi:hypothetical protein